MTKTTTMMLAGIAIAMVASGCNGAAWQMRRGAWSGELALHGPMVDAEYAAQDAMAAHCGGRARIVEGAEAERVALADSASVPAHEVTVDRSGRRVHYVCVSRAPVAFRTPGPSEHRAATVTVASRDAL
jgi:hypothetical protein